MAARLRLATMKLGQAFAAFGVLAPRGHFRLGAVLHDSSTLFPSTTADFAMLEIPFSADVRSAFVARLGDAIVGVVDGELSTWRLGAVVPGAGRLTGGVDTAAGTTNRLVGLVRSNGLRGWDELVGCTIGEIRDWHGAGPKLTAQLVVMGYRSGVGVAFGAKPSPDGAADGSGDPPQDRRTTSPIRRWIHPSDDRGSGVRGP